MPEPELSVRPRGEGPELTASVFLLVFAGYAWCAYPTIAPRDSADLAAAALSLGVAHPPGYPLYSLLGRAWIAALGLGGAAYRLNLLSAACGAAAAAGLFSLLRRKVGPGPALGAALGTAWTAAVWKFCLLEEMYALHALVIVLLLGLSQGGRPSLLRRACLSALVFGLGLVNHQSLILLTPALAYLWKRELQRHRCDWSLLRRGPASLLALGLGVEAALWIRLGDPRLAWAVATRAEYGTFELFGGFARPFSVEGSLALLAHLAAGLWGAGAAVLAGLSAAALWEFLDDAAGDDPGRGERKTLAVGALAALAGFGPAFFLATRFDLSEWVARSVLESAFVAPTICLGVLGGLGLGVLWRRSRNLGLIAAVAAAAVPLALNAPRLDHREDFSAYDYARDLRRCLPPGSAAVVGGDTALFSLRYLGVERGFEDRAIASARETGLADWIARQLTVRQVFVLGLPLGALDTLGLGGRSLTAWPAGLVQRVAAEKPTVDLETSPWALSSVRYGRAGRDDSYAHDIRLCYAFAHYLSGQLQEKLGYGNPGAHYELAALDDPEDYRIELSPAKP